MGALRLELEQKSPFDTVCGWVFWQGSLACVWYWSQELEARVRQASQPAGNQLEFVPEAALWPQLDAGGYRWVQEQGNALVLVQYQHPKHGLYEKRYSAAVSREEVAAWLRRHGAGDVSADRLVAAASPGYDKPFGQSLEGRSSSLESRVFPLSAALLGFFVLVYGVAIIRAGVGSENARERAEQMEQSISGIVALRQKAASLQSQTALLAEFNAPSQVEVAAELAELLEVEGGRLVRWAYRDGRLELSWEPEGPLPDSTRVITALEEAARFGDVQAQARGNTVMEISTRVATARREEPVND
ncbi:hypothetical protein C8D92_101281 [Tamilnaduibacter salinus]|uniref:Uncharacterized protein n=1 Tax=Tamilnaduibacter salinus TaxID=1484056 RepID=A0A2U1D109_9GAMM|nr:hypothetical protein C8D92_101281 [Tamilnaduibacter salinus]